MGILWKYVKSNAETQSTPNCGEEPVLFSTADYLITSKSCSFKFLRATATKKMAPITVRETGQGLVLWKTGEPTRRRTVDG